MSRKVQLNFFASEREGMSCNAKADKVITELGHGVLRESIPSNS